MAETHFNSDDDLRWMTRALELARRGTGLCSPNPMVGCVVLDSAGQLAGEGWHEYDLRDHAEVVALRTAGKQARGGTAYVTLEPCNHTGRTGPCSQALIQAGVARVVTATVDPNPLVAGQGLQTLRTAGISVAVGVCEPEARQLNEGFARWIVSKRPFVDMKVAMSADGMIAPAPSMHSKREPFWITGDAARAEVQRMRWAADAVLTGVGTVLADDPLLTDRSSERRRRPLLRVVVDSSLRLPLDSKLVISANDDVLVFTVSTDTERIEALNSRGVQVEVLPVEKGKVPLSLVLERLGAKQLLTALTETGTGLNTALLAGGLVNRLTIFSSPRALGVEAVPAFEGAKLPGRMHNPERARYGDDFRVSELLLNPWIGH